MAVAFIGAALPMSSGISRMPEIKAQVGATATELAFALVCTGIGSIISMPFAGRLAARFGTARPLAVFATIGMTATSLIPQTSSVPQLALVLFGSGLGIGTWDVTMNIQGSIVERARGQVLMSLWHGLFSVGAVVGALIGAGTAALGIPLGWHLPVISAVCWAATVSATTAFLPNSVTDTVVASSAGGGADQSVTSKRPVTAGHDAAAAPPRPGRRSRVTRTEILLGLIMLSTSLGEGAANDWLAVALVDERAAPAAVGALALAGFNITMAIGRFAGGPLIARFGRVAALRTSGSVAAVGIIALCLVPSTGVAFAGAAAWGLGLAVIFPSAISAAGETPGRASQAIATVSTIGYGGFLLGAPLIGTMAHAIPLLDALLVVAAFAILVVVLAPHARERTGGSASSTVAVEP